MTDKPGKGVACNILIFSPSFSRQTNSRTVVNGARLRENVTLQGKKTGYELRKIRGGV